LVKHSLFDLSVYIKQNVVSEVFTHNSYDRLNDQPPLIFGSPIEQNHWKTTSSTTKVIEAADSHENLAPFSAKRLEST
jgi:hypothetical protein